MKKIISAIRIAKTRHSRAVPAGRQEGGNPERHWIPGRACLPDRQARNDKLHLVICLLPGLLLLWASFATAAVPIEVTLGKETVLTLKNPSQRISLANPETADVKLISPSEIVLNGKKPGITSLIIWDQEGKKIYDVIVSDYTSIQNERKIEDLGMQIKGIAPEANIKIHLVGDTIVLSGKLKNEITRKKIETVPSLHGYSKVFSLLSVEEAQQVIVEVKVAQIDKTKLKDLGISALTKQ
ncbi:MAG TPA: pilus assembly protein N-terminal domain-containing protein, partial [Thermodesulfovibrionales bacterium]|nr:pilus assembly protein N-terminal domain-containing protein [Thermodesulfovibrionales bacterium]